VTVNEKTRARDQLDLIHKITTTLAEGSGRAWLFGGWGLDTRIGRVTRDTTQTAQSQPRFINEPEMKRPTRK
jgi:hypothetical protein